jgi:hypothetical protein
MDLPVDTVPVKVCPALNVIAPVITPPARGNADEVCHVAVVPAVAVKICPTVGAADAETLTVVVAEFRLFAAVNVEGVCHVAVVPAVAVKTCPTVGAADAETLTVVVADRSPDAIAVTSTKSVPFQATRADAPAAIVAPVVAAPLTTTTASDLLTTTYALL